MLAVIKGDEGSTLSKDGKKTKKMVLKDMREEDAVKLTRIKMNTLDPVWNETFELLVFISKQFRVFNDNIINSLL